MKKTTKRVFVVVLCLAMIFAMAACGKKAETQEASGGGSAEATATEDVQAKGEGVMTYAEYADAALDTEVTIETFVQAKQSWWEDKATVYTQDADGAYFLYNMACSQEDYDKLVEGQKIKVKGYKAEWSGEVEIVDATFEIEDGNWIAEPMDATDLLGNEDIIQHQNKKVSFSGMTIEPKKDANGNEVAFLYSWDGSGSQGDDLYFDVSKDGKTYTFTVESYLCDKDSDVYKAVEGLNVGDTVDLEGFLYWYEGVNPHITAVK